MFVCPKCDEEIPDRVKKTTEECPFCHEPWPPEEVDEPEPAAEEGKSKKKAGWGDDFKPSAAADPSQVHHEEPAKSKAWIFILVAVLVVGGGLGAYFAFGGKKAKKGTATGGGGAKGGVSESEIGAIDGWYRNASKKVDNFLGAQCASYHAAGYKYQTHLKKRVQHKTVRGKKVTTFDFELKVLPDPKAKASGALNVFECPVKVAEIHRDHPLVMEAEVWEKREVFGAVFKFANVSIKGKLTGHLKKRLVKRNVVLQNRKGFAFSRMKNLPKTPEYEGYRALSTPMRFRMHSGGRTFTMGNLDWHKFKSGKYIQGSWRTTLKTKEFAKQLKDWDDGCLSFRKSITKLDKPKKGHRTHYKLTRVERAVTKDICAALSELAKATKGDKVDQAAINKAKATLDAARTKWNTELHKKMKDIAKKLDTAILGKPL